MKNKIIDLLKNVDLYRYIISMLLMTFAIVKAIKFTNAGTNYMQAYEFRPICIVVAVVILLNLKYKEWFNIWTLIYVPVCYVVTHFAYEKHLIYDINNYEHVDVIRNGKIIILLWGIIILSMVRYSIQSKIWTRIKELRLSIIIPFVLFSICVLLFRKYYTETLFIVVEVIGFAYLMKDKKAKDLMVKVVTDAIILSFVLVMYKCLIHRPYDLERYDLIFNNSNNAGTYVAAVVIAFFSKIDIWWKKDCKKSLKTAILLVYYLSLGVSISIALFNYTRTTLAGLIFAFVVSFVLSLIRVKKLNVETAKSVWLRFGLVIAALICTFNLTYLAIRYIPAYCDSPVYYLGENEALKIQKGDPIDSPKYTSINNYLRLAFGKWGVLIKFEDDKQSESQEEKLVLDGRDVTGGRMEIWSLFINQLNLTGTYPFGLYGEDGVLYTHSHNSYLMMAHMLGIIAGVIYGVLCIGLFVWALIAYVNSLDKAGTYLFAVLFVATCLISQISEWISRPQHAFYMVFIMVIGVLFNYKTKRDTE